MRYQTDGANVTIMETCQICKKSFRFVVPTEAFDKWRSGALIQTALTTLNAGERELLISGHCDFCFDELFKDL